MVLRDSIDRTAMHKLAVGGAWFFIVVSLLYLTWAALMLTSGATSYASLYTGVNNGEAVGAIGLSYSGGFGIALAMLEALVIAAAVVATVLRVPKWRRFGHVTLMSWAALWALNLTWLASIDPGFISYGQSLTMTTLLGCTIYRAMRGWNMPVRRRNDANGPVENAVAFEMHDAAAVSPMGFENVTADDISRSDAVLELQCDDVPAQSRWSRLRTMTMQLLQRGREGLVESVVWIWPYVRTAGVNFWKVVVAQFASLAGWLRGKGILPQRTSTSATAQT